MTNRMFWAGLLLGLAMGAAIQSDHGPAAAAATPARSSAAVPEPVYGDAAAQAAAIDRFVELAREALAALGPDLVGDRLEGGWWGRIQRTYEARRAWRQAQRAPRP